MALMLVILWCRRWGSNPHELEGPLDFESSASASSATSALLFCNNRNIDKDEKQVIFRFRLKKWEVIFNSYKSTITTQSLILLVPAVE